MIAGMEVHIVMKVGADGKVPEGLALASMDIVKMQCHYTGCKLCHILYNDILPVHIFESVGTREPLISFFGSQETVNHLDENV